MVPVQVPVQWAPLVKYAWVFRGLQLVTEAMCLYARTARGLFLVSDEVPTALRSYAVYTHGFCWVSSW